MYVCMYVCILECHFYELCVAMQNLQVSYPASHFFVVDELIGHLRCYHHLIQQAGRAFLVWDGGHFLAQIYFVALWNIGLVHVCMYTLMSGA